MTKHGSYIHMCYIQNNKTPPNIAPVLWVTVSEELDNLKAHGETSPHADNEEDVPSDATMHYNIPKITSVTRDLMEFLIEYQGDHATHISHWIHQQVSQYTHTD